jgi:hypothetical protein
MSSFSVRSTRHVRCVRLGKLHGEGTHTSTRTVDQDLLFRLHVSLIANALECDEPRGGYSRGLLEHETGRLQRQRVFGGRHIFGKGAAVVPLVAADVLAENVITRPKLRDVPANRFNRPGKIRTRNTVAWHTQPGPDDTQEVRHASHHVPDIGMQTIRVNSYQHLIIPDHRLVDLSEFKDIR